MPSNNIVRMCAAGSGKTWGICNDALSVVNAGDSTKRVLITTYTNKGIDTVNSEIEKQNQGVPSSRIVVRSWFQFLMSEFIRPYQSFITEINDVKSFDFTPRYGQVNYERKGEKRRYFSGNSYVKQDYASELAVYLNERNSGLTVNRLEQIYSHIFIDEIQDMAGYDLNIIRLLFESSITVICVGDNKQATYRTHNTRKNKNRSGANLWDFCYELEDSQAITIERSLESRRFNSNICVFANAVYPNDNNITTCMSEVTGHDGVYIISKDDVKLYLEWFAPVVLRYDKKTNVGNLTSFNFGQCKGMTFDRVLVFPNNPLKGIISGKKLNSPEKYYVAVTRPRYSLSIVLDRLPKSDLFETAQIAIGDTSITALRFIESRIRR